MLKPAQFYTDELQHLFRKTWFDDKYLFYHNGCYYEEFLPEESTVNDHQFVSVARCDVIGFIGYSVDRAANVVFDLNIINFTDDKITFSKDVMQAIDDIFCKFNFNKIEFNVYIGNPAEKMYDKFINKCGGRIVGTYTKHCKLADGRLYDLKMYELFKDGYLRNRKDFLKLD